MKRLQPRPNEPFAQQWNDWMDEQHTVSVMFETWKYYLETSVSQFPQLGSEEKPDTEPEGKRYCLVGGRWVDLAELRNPGIHKDEQDDGHTHYHVIIQTEEMTLPNCQEYIQEIYDEYGDALRLMY
jgi:hypothetical protein